MIVQLLTLLLLASALVSCRHMDNTISINIKGDFNLGYTTRGRGNANQAELAQQLIVIGHFTFTLVNLDLYLGLAISSCGEYLGEGQGEP